MSQLAGGINFTSVTYDDTTGNRLVTGPLGISETYKFTMLQGVPKVTEIDRASNGTVTFSSRHFTYDSNGYLKTATDWNGNQTAYTNNSHGLPTQIVYASGNAVSHTTSISYDTTWARLAHVVTTPGVTTTLNYSFSPRHAADPRAGRHDQHVRAVFDQRPDPHLDHDLHLDGPACDAAASRARTSPRRRPSPTRAGC